MHFFIFSSVQKTVVKEKEKFKNTSIQKAWQQQKYFVHLPCGMLW
jgi:hypothetical protein